MVVEAKDGILTGAGRGFCSGGAIGGADVALACGVRIAGEAARFAETCAKTRLAPGGGT